MIGDEEHRQQRLAVAIGIQPATGADVTLDSLARPRGLSPHSVWQIIRAGRGPVKPGRDGSEAFSPKERQETGTGWPRCNRLLRPAGLAAR